MTYTVYNLVSDLPIDPEVGDAAFVVENKSHYISEDLSTFVAYSFKFNHQASSRLDVINGTNSFTNTNDPFTVEFWSFNQTLSDDPIFSIIDPITTNTFIDASSNNISFTVGSNLNSFVHSPYSTEYITSEYFSSSDNISIIDQIDIQSEPFTIQYFMKLQNENHLILEALAGSKISLSIGNDKIVDNGMEYERNDNINTDSWEHNLLTYDGIDYKLYKNGINSYLKRDSSFDVDSEQLINLNTYDITKDAGFRCKVLFPSSPSEGVLFKAGEGNFQIKVSLINSGNTLEMVGGDLSITTTDFPNDANDHIVSWDIQVNPARIRLWIDGILKGEASSVNPISNNVWAAYSTTDRLTEQGNIVTSELQIALDRTIGYVGNHIGLQTNVANLYPNLSPNSTWIVDFPFRNISRVRAGKASDTGFKIDMNGSNIYYFEIVTFIPQSLPFTDFADGGHIKLEIFDENKWEQSRGYSGMDNTWVASLSLRTSSNTDDSSSRRIRTFSVFVNELTKKIHVFRDGRDSSSYDYRTLDYSTFNSTAPHSQYKVLTLLTHYCARRCVVKYSPNDWSYGPYYSKFLETNNLNRIYGSSTGAIGGYGLSSIGEDSFPGELRSTLRHFNQTFLYLDSSNVSIGKSYTGYIKDFEIKDGYSSNPTVPTSEITAGSDTKFLLKSSNDGELILDYRVNGRITKNEVEELQVRDSHNINTWTHTMLSYDGTNMRVYEDGSLSYNQPLDFRGKTLSEGSFSIGSSYKFNSNTASRDNIFLQGNIADFILHDSAKETGNNFNLRTSAYIPSTEEIVYTAYQSLVPNDGTLQNINGVDVETFSPYTTTTKGWQKKAILTKSSTNHNITVPSSRPSSVPSGENYAFGYDYIDSFPEPISGLITLDANDINGNPITWSLHEHQQDSFYNIKKDNNKILIEPILLSIDPEYNNGAFSDVTGDGSDFFKREVTVNGVRIMAAGTVGGQTAVPDSFVEKIARMFELFTDPNGAGINESAQRGLIRNLSGDSATYHAGFPTIQRVARGAGADYTPNFLTDSGVISWNLTNLFDTHVQNDMVWYLNSTGDSYGDGDIDAQEVIEHVFHTLHMHGLPADDISLYPYLDSNWPTSDLYAAMEEAYDAGKWDPSGYEPSPGAFKTNADAFEVAAKEYLYLLNFCMFEYTSLWEGGSLSPEWTDDMRTASGIQTNNPLGYAFHNTYIAPVISKPSLTTIRSIFQDGNTPAQDDPTLAGVSGYIVTQTEYDYDRLIYLHIEGKLSNDSAPIIDVSDQDPYTNLNYIFEATDDAIWLTDMSNRFLQSYFTLQHKDSSIDSDFQSIPVRPFKTLNDILISRNLIESDYLSIVNTIGDIS